MNVQFSEIHNVIRTYQRILRLDPPDAPKAGPPASEGDDRVSISHQARELQGASERAGDGQPTAQHRNR